MSAQPNKNTEKSIKETNEFRQLMGLKIYKPTKRKCLRCGNDFKSYSPAERMCCLGNFRHPDFIPII